MYRYLTHSPFPISQFWRDNYSPLHDRDEVSNVLEIERLNYLPSLVLVVLLHTFPPTFIPSVIVYMAAGGFGAACAEYSPLALSAKSRFRSFPGSDPTVNS
jgi:hypothetical protein